MKTFNELIKLTDNHAPRNLLIGNGYSIAASDSFKYSSLKEQTDFTGIEWIKCVFNKYGVSDFELILEVLGHAIKVASCTENKEEENKYKESKNALIERFIQALKDVHPENDNTIDSADNISAAQYEKNGAFLKYFESIFSLNYDLLLYRSIMKNKYNKNELNITDGFSNKDKSNSILIFDKNLISKKYTIHVYYLHGALHLRTDTENETQKLKYETGSNLLEQVAEGLRNNIYPTIVFEGTDKEKIHKIKSNSYLDYANQALSELSGSLFTFGFSFSANDKHIQNSIVKSNISQLCVGVNGDIDQPRHKNIKEACATMMREAKLANDTEDRDFPLDIFYYDTSQKEKPFPIWDADQTV